MEWTSKERGPRVDLDASALHRLRQKAGLTQLELAQKANVTPVTISRIENGHVLPNLVTLERLAAALNVPIERLAGPILDVRPHRNPRPAA